MDLFPKINYKIYRIALVFWAAFLLVLLLMPASSFAHPPQFLAFKEADKFVHFCLFGFLTYLTFENLIINKFYQKHNIYFWCVIFVSFFGFITECLQELFYNTSKRKFSFGDWFFDTLASIVIIICLMIFYHYYYKSK